MSHNFFRSAEFLSARPFASIPEISARSIMTEPGGEKAAYVLFYSSFFLFIRTSYPVISCSINRSFTFLSLSVRSAMQKKAAGNESYKKGNYVAAAQLYSEAIGSLSLIAFFVGVLTFEVLIFLFSVPDSAGPHRRVLRQSLRCASDVQELSRRVAGLDQSDRVGSHYDQGILLVDYFL
jgi:hypothetical protein